MSSRSITEFVISWTIRWNSSKRFRLNPNLKSPQLFRNLPYPLFDKYIFLDICYIDSLMPSVIFDISSFEFEEITLYEFVNGVSLHAWIKQLDDQLCFLDKVWIKIHNKTKFVFLFFMNLRSIKLHRLHRALMYNTFLRG